jgi:hypothetical protein
VYVRLKDNKKNYQDLTIGIIMEILNNLIYLPQPQFEVAVLCQTFIGLLRICFVLICAISWPVHSDEVFCFKYIVCMLKKYFSL